MSIIDTSNKNIPAWRMTAKHRCQIGYFHRNFSRQLFFLLVFATKMVAAWNAIFSFWKKQYANYEWAGLHGSMLPPDKLEFDVSFSHFDSLLVPRHPLRLCSQFDLGFRNAPSPRICLLYPNLRLLVPVPIKFSSLSSRLVDNHSYLTTLSGLILHMS